jgi:hypothetical protein
MDIVRNVANLQQFHANRILACIVHGARCVGADTKALLRRQRTDATWSRQLHALRELLEVEPRP